MQKIEMSQLPGLQAWVSTAVEMLSSGTVDRVDKLFKVLYAEQSKNIEAKAYMAGNTLRIDLTEQA